MTYFPSFTRSFRATFLVLASSVVFGCVLTAHAQAQPKIATADLKKIFEGYFKTQQADAQLRERGAEAEKQYKVMLDDYQKASEEYKKLVESANDQAVSSEERERRKKSAETKVLELNEIEKTLTQFKRQKQQAFDEQKARMRDQIVREIREQINDKARRGGFTLVLDSSAESMNAASFILYSSGQNDLTQEVLSQLNLAAPAGFFDSKGTNTRGDIKLNVPDQDKNPAQPAKRR
ncbi:MAG: OmpH family outer membrane protein [Verrucomicrobiia bacterium]